MSFRVELEVMADISNSVHHAFVNAKDYGYPISGVVFPTSNSKVADFVETFLENTDFRWSVIEGVIPMNTESTMILPNGYPWHYAAWLALNNIGPQNYTPLTYFISKDCGYKFEAQTEWFDPNCVLYRPVIELTFV